MSPSRKTSHALMLGVSFALAVVAAGLDRPVVAATTSPATSATNTDRPADVASDVRLSKLVGMRVRNTAGEQLGEVKDVILDTNTGRVAPR